MRIVQLVPNTARLKQVVKEHGDVWIALCEPTPMQCFNGDDGMRICSLDNVHTRNVRCDTLVPCVKAKAVVSCGVLKSQDG